MDRFADEASGRGKEQVAEGEPATNEGFVPIHRQPQRAILLPLPFLCGGAMRTLALAILALLTIPALAAERQVYHDCRPSEDIVNGRTVHKTICQNQNGDWVEPQPEKRNAPRPPVPALAAQQTKPIKKPVYHDCRPAQDIVNGRPVWKAICQNEAGAWVEKPGNY